MEDPARRIATALSDEYPVEERLRVNSVRLTLASAYIQMQRKGHFALVHHGINYHSLPEYMDQSRIEDSKDLSLWLAAEGCIEWCRRVEHGIEAAIKRKSFRKV